MHGATLPRSVETLVVGAGAAGSVIAARVTEDSAREVLLLEAGPDHPDPATLPADLADGRQNSLRHHDWGFQHRPTSVQIRFPLPRGRVVGGSSAVNTCIAVRGQPEDFDEWAARGLPEWSWEHCLPAFRRLETDLDFPGGPFHGDSGPLPLRRPPPEELTPWQAGFIEAGRYLGFPDVPDTNVPHRPGVGTHAFNRIDGRRISAAEAWLTPEVRARPNLQVLGDTHVLRVTFEGRRATGVDVRRDGQVHHIAAKRVVLCAGAVLTPAILLRSGVGPGADLRRLGVDPVADVPAVGARLLDHPGHAIFLRPRRGVSRTSDPIIQSVLRYAGHASTHPADMQLQAGSKLAFSRWTMPGVTIMGQVGKPRGAGRLHFASADPDAKPVIDSHMLQDPHDLRLAVEAMELAYALSQTPPLRALATPLWPRPRTFQSAARVAAWIPRATDSGYHPCGTVPMGSEDDPAAATDGRGRVRGVEGLVVADASLMPTIPSSNTHLPTLMIGERFGVWLRSAPS